MDPGNSHLRVIFRLTVKIYPTRRFSRTRISGNRRPLENLLVETSPEKSLLYGGKLLLNGVVLEVQHTTWVWEITRGHTWPPTWISMSHLTYRNKVRLYHHPFIYYYVWIQLLKMLFIARSKFIVLFFFVSKLVRSR